VHSVVHNCCTEHSTQQFPLSSRQPPWLRCCLSEERVAKASLHKATPLLHTDHSIVFNRWRQCAQQDRPETEDNSTVVPETISIMRHVQSCDLFLKEHVERHDCEEAEIRWHSSSVRCLQTIQSNATMRCQSFQQLKQILHTTIPISYHRYCFTAIIDTQIDR